MRTLSTIAALLLAACTGGNHARPRRPARAKPPASAAESVPALPPELSLCATVGQPTFRHFDTVESLRFSADGQRLVTWGKDRRLHLWSLSGPQLEQSWTLDMVSADRAVLSPDGRLLAVASEGLQIVRLDTQERHEVAATDIAPLAFTPSASGLLCAETYAAGSCQLTERDPTTLRVGAAVSCDEGLPSAVAFAGPHLLWTGSELGAVALREWPSGQLARIFQLHADAVRVIAPSADGSLVASASQGADEALVWNATTGRILTRVRVTGDALLFIGAARLLVGNTLVDAASGRTLQVLADGAPDDERSPPVTAALSPDGKLLATGHGDGRTLVWDAATGQLLTAPPQRQGLVTGLALAPADDSVLVARDDDSLALLEAASGRQVRLLESARTACRENNEKRRYGLSDKDSIAALPLSISAGGANGPVLVSLAADRLTMIFGDDLLVHDGKETQVAKLPLWAQGSETRDIGVFVARGGLLVVGVDSEANELVVWDPALGHARARFAVDALAELVGLSPDGTLAFLADAGGLEARSTHTGKVQWRSPELLSPIVFTGEGGLAVSPSYSEQRGDGFAVWRVSDGRVLRSISGVDPTNAERTLDRPLALANDGSLLVGGFFGARWAMGIWSTVDGRMLRMLGEHDSLPHSVAIDARGEHASALFYAGDKPTALEIWSLVTGELIRTIRPAAPPKTEALAGLLADSGGEAVFVRSTARSKRIERWRLALEPSGDLATSFSRFVGEDRWIAAVPYASNDRLLEPLPAADGGPLLCAEGIGGYGFGSLEARLESGASIATLAVSTDGRSAVFAAADGKLDLWRAGEAFELRRPGGPSITSLAISADGGLMALATADGGLELWSFARKERRALQRPGEAGVPCRKDLLAAPAPGPSPVRAARFSPDRRALATVSEDGGLALWPLVPGDATRRTCVPTRGAEPCALAFAGSGKVLWVGTSNGLLFRYGEP